MLRSAIELASCVSDFSVELEQLAWSIAREIVARELAVRPAAVAPKARRGSRPPRASRAVPPAETPVAAPAEAPVAAPVAAGRQPWTRDRVIDELARWMIDLPGLDAMSLKRRKQGALVTAAKREFGRFEAALNAANLALAQKYPDGIPKAHELAKR